MAGRGERAELQPLGRGRETSLLADNLQMNHRHPALGDEGPDRGGNPPGAEREVRLEVSREHRYFAREQPARHRPLGAFDIAYEGLAVAQCGEGGEAALEPCNCRVVRACCATVSTRWPKRPASRRAPARRRPWRSGRIWCRAGGAGPPRGTPGRTDRRPAGPWAQRLGHAHVQDARSAPRAVSSTNNGQALHHLARPWPRCVAPAEVVVAVDVGQENMAAACGGILARKCAKLVSSLAACQRRARTAIAGDCAVRVRDRAPPDAIPGACPRVRSADVLEPWAP